MRRRTRVVLCSFVIALSALSVASAWGSASGAFPRIRSGVGGEPTAGSGDIAGDSYVGRSAVVAWNRRFHILTLYLLPNRTTTCASLFEQLHAPGHKIQVQLTTTPRARIGPVENPEVAFITVFAGDRPPHVAGLSRGGEVSISRIDTTKGGVWHGSFRVPTRLYGDRLLYGYQGTFAARWCSFAR
jgi:hypothetical protein